MICAIFRSILYLIHHKLKLSNINLNILFLFFSFTLVKWVSTSRQPDKSYEKQRKRSLAYRHSVQSLQTFVKSREGIVGMIKNLQAFTNLFSKSDKEVITTKTKRRLTSLFVTRLKFLCISILCLCILKFGWTNLASILYSI